MNQLKQLNSWAAKRINVIACNDTRLGFAPRSQSFVFKDCVLVDSIPLSQKQFTGLFLLGRALSEFVSLHSYANLQSHNRGVMTMMRLRTKSAMTGKDLTIVERIAVPFRHSAMTGKDLTIVERIAVPFRHSAMTEQTVGWAYLPNKGKQAAFTLAEVLITLAIIGIVAAITIPNFIHNYQQKVQKEQVRMVKYKLTQATR